GLAGVPARSGVDRVLWLCEPTQGGRYLRAVSWHRSRGGDVVEVHEFLPFILIGLTAGSVYGLAGAGLVLTYKTSGIFNFAYGAIAAVAAYVFYWLHVQEGVSW